MRNKIGEQGNYDKEIQIIKTISPIFAPLLFTILSYHDISAQDLLHKMFAHPEKYTEDMNKIFSTYSDGETLSYSEGSVKIINDHFGKRIILISKEGDHFAFEWKDGTLELPYPNLTSYRDHPYSYGSTLNNLLKSVSNQSEDEKRASFEMEMENITGKYGKSISDTVTSGETHKTYEPYFDVIRGLTPQEGRGRNRLHPTARSNLSKK